MTSITRTHLVGALAAMALTTTLAGCAAAAEPTVGEEPAAPEAEEGPTTDGGDAGYIDGTYTASGSYQSPGGTETIEVTLTIADDIVTDVSVTNDPATSDSERYQGQFIDGIADVVVGEDIDSLSVDRVAGSSLTSGGFNDALDEIKAEALA